MYSLNKKNTLPNPKYIFFNNIGQTFEIDCRDDICSGVTISVKRYYINGKDVTSITYVSFTLSVKCYVIGRQLAITISSGDHYIIGRYKRMPT